jgi:phosphatidylglycerol:prolipoprotein diacylglycerol transferase
MLAIAFPQIDPVAIALGPLVIRWYALAYIAGLLLGWRYCRYLAARGGPITPDAFDDFLTWATIGVVVGGRLGYVLFYQPGYHLANPLEIFKVWQGGMSYHGGMLGVLIAIFLYARRYNLPALALGDLVAAATPIGLFFGRIANFVNGELWGRPADVPWAVVFPTGGPEPRHPSQLYEATLEGLVLFALLAWLSHKPALRARHGLIGGVFLMGYGVARIIGEMFREPDSFLGFFAYGTTMGQWLSMPMVLVGLVLVLRAKRA